MRILLATFWIIPHVGGVWNYMGQLKKKLELLGHEVDILGFGEGNKYVYIVNEHRKVKRSKLIPLVEKKQGKKPYPENYADPVVKYCEVESRVFELAAAYLGLDKYEVIHTQDVLSTVCLKRVKPSGTALVATLHGCVSHEMRHQIMNSPTFEMAKAYFDQLEYIGATSAKYTIVANQWLKNILMDEFKVPDKKLKILHYGYDVETFLSQMIDKSAIQLQRPIVRPANKKVILYTGRLVELKGVHHLLSALSQLKEIRKDWVCWIVGEGEKYAELKVQSEVLELTDYVFFYEKRDDIPRILARSDIFVLPSLLENQSLSVIEAQIAGKPVIVSDAGGLPEMVEHGVTGIISPAGDVEKLCYNLDILLGDKAYRKELGANAKKWGMAYWSLDEGVRNVVKVYESSLSQKRKIEKNSPST
ncbi:glycosyltransferase family 1 protein [Paenibacillus psychroresistens]|uniref:Glycosyltransferase family 1 protein n=1 Tax=Paenibacillus psychroresistens TaxID=1778678 RepID=A0A6B8RHF8_9BACL|nr:glycosyltransferase family 4 protein [Paenibacillus psychroresistens]QGQ95499.1 glycosyltransferase family 1 protein [Paenibacillus psychroresistens]